MTKKLEEFFNLDPADIHEAKELDEPTVEQTRQEIAIHAETIRSVDNAIDKINVALPTVRDLEASDQEMDELASLAQEKFQDLMDLGMNVDPRFAGMILQTANGLLGHAITAKTAKMDKKLKMVQLQLQKAKLDHQIKKDSNQDDGVMESEGVVISRDELLKQLLDANKSNN